VPDFKFLILIPRGHPENALSDINCPWSCELQFRNCFLEALFADSFLILTEKKLKGQNNRAYFYVKISSNLSYKVLSLNFLKLTNI